MLSFLYTAWMSPHFLVVLKVVIEVFLSIDCFCFARFDAQINFAQYCRHCGHWADSSVAAIRFILNFDSLFMKCIHLFCFVCVWNCHSSDYEKIIKVMSKNRNSRDQIATQHCLFMWWVWLRAVRNTSFHPSMNRTKIRLWAISHCGFQQGKRRSPKHRCVPLAAISMPKVQFRMAKEY